MGVAWFSFCVACFVDRRCNKLFKAKKLLADEEVQTDKEMQRVERDEETEERKGERQRANRDPGFDPRGKVGPMSTW